MITQYSITYLEDVNYRIQSTAYSLSSEQTTIKTIDGVDYLLVGDEQIIITDSISGDMNDIANTFLEQGGRGTSYVLKEKFTPEDDILVIQKKLLPDRKVPWLIRLQRGDDTKIVEVFAIQILQQEKDNKGDNNETNL